MAANPGEPQVAGRIEVAEREGVAPDPSRLLSLAALALRLAREDLAKRADKATADGKRG